MGSLLSTQSLQGYAIRLLPANSHTKANHKFKFNHLQSNCEAFRPSFIPTTIASWNSIPFQAFDTVKAVRVAPNQKQ